MMIVLSIVLRTVYTECTEHTTVSSVSMSVVTGSVPVDEY